MDNDENVQVAPNRTSSHFMQRNVTKTSLYILCMSMSTQIEQPEIFSSKGRNYEVPSTPTLGGALCCIPCYEDFDDHLVEGNAFDVIMIEGSGAEQGQRKLYQNSDFLVSFSNTPDCSHKIVLEIQSNDESDESAWFPVVRVNECDEVKDEVSSDSERSAWGCCHPGTMSGKIMGLNETLEDQDIASKLAPYLKPGRNPVRYLLLDDKKVLGMAHANIFLWSHKDSIIVSDIDGTITKSNTRGVIDTILTENYRYCHQGICELLSHLAEQPRTQVLYVTSRPIALASRTRKFLANLRQGSAQLPEGPMLGFDGNLPQLLMMELISMNTHHFKAEMLWKQVVQPFQQVSNGSSPIFLAGLGNTIMDVQAYHMVGIDLGKIYLIDKKSQISGFDKNLNQSWKKLTSTSSEDRFIPSTIRAPMSRGWYKSRMGSTFQGYSDPNLLSHVLTYENDSECDGNALMG